MFLKMNMSQWFWKMIKNIYEILNEFKQASSKQERVRILKENAYPHFLHVLKYAFDPNIKFYVNKFPKEYIKPDTFPGIRYAGIESEIRKTYLFRIGDPTADSLSEEKRNQLLTILLESFEPQEATVFVNMLNKNLKTPHLTTNLINEVFPNLL
jgi:hypothetical protein